MVEEQVASSLLGGLLFEISLNNEWTAKDGLIAEDDVSDAALLVLDAQVVDGYVVEVEDKVVAWLTASINMTSFKGLLFLESPLTSSPISI